jgi:tRNA modification GTPase
MLPAGAAPVEVSAVTGEGLPALRRAIRHALCGGEPLRDTPAITNARHLALAETARRGVAAAAEALAEGATEELALGELGRAREALEAITGRRSAEDLLRHVFGRFCVGK